MAENKEILEQSNSVSQQENLDDTSQYIEALKEMKQNSVSKEAYQKLKDENRQLLDSLINGSQIDIQQMKPEITDEYVNGLRKKLFNPDEGLSNLEYAKTAIELRDALLEKGEIDPFLPVGHNITPTDEDYVKADRVGQVLKECIDYANGDSELFTNELMRRTNDSMPLRSAAKNNRKR